MISILFATLCSVYSHSFNPVWKLVYVSAVWSPEHVEIGMVRLWKIVRLHFFTSSEANFNWQQYVLVFKVSHKIPCIAEEDNHVIIKRSIFKAQWTLVF